MSAFFTCPDGHHERLPYRGPTTAWCEQCNSSVQFKPVPPAPRTPAQIEADGNDTFTHIRKRMEQFTEMLDASRQGIKRPTEANPENDRERAVVARLRNAGFPERHIASLRGMDTQGAAFSRLADDALRAKPGPVACLLWGDYGRGKTQVAVGLGMLRAQRDERTRYVMATDLIREIKDNFQTKIPEGVLLRRYHECACLILDDVHAALDDRPEEVKWARAQIQGILDTRYRSNGPLKTVLIANAATPEELNLRIGGHILSRVNEDGKVIRLNSKNYRAK